MFFLNCRLFVWCLLLARLLECGTYCLTHNNRRPVRKVVMVGPRISVRDFFRFSSRVRFSQLLSSSVGLNIAYGIQWLWIPWFSSLGKWSICALNSEMILMEDMISVVAYVFAWKSIMKRARVLMWSFCISRCFLGSPIT